MTEERICATCKYVDEETCEYIHQRCVRPEGICMNHGKWQPIQKPPSFQITEEEAREILSVVFNHEIHTKQDVIDSISDLKKAGYIRKSELQILVDESEEIIKQEYEYVFATLKGGEAGLRMTNIEIMKLFETIEALKKDHPEFK